MINDIVKNKYIRATSDEHGARIIQFLVENGGVNPYNLKGLNGFSYYITSKGSAESFKDNRPKGYSEMYLPEELKRGDLVEVTNNLAAWNHGQRILAGIVGGSTRPFVAVIEGDEELFHSGEPFDTSSWKHCRKVETITREEAEKQLGKKIVG